MNLPNPIPKPLVKIQGPTVCGICGNITLSMDISTGNLGQKFSKIEWRIMSPNITKFPQNMENRGTKSKKKLKNFAFHVFR